MELVQEEDFLFQSLQIYEYVYMSEYVYVYHWFLCVCHNRIGESTSSSYIEPVRDGEPTVGSEANSVFECRPHRLLCQQSYGGQHHGVSSSVSLQVQNPTSQESKPGEAQRGGGGGRSLLSWKFVKEAKVERQSKLEQNKGSKGGEKINIKIVSLKDVRSIKLVQAQPKFLGSMINQSRQTFFS